VVCPTLGAAGWGGRPTVENRLKVAAARANKVWASMVGSGVVEGAEGPDGVFGLAPRGDVAEGPAISALSIAVGGVGPLNGAGPGAKSVRGTYRKDVPWVDGDDGQGRGLTSPRFRVWVVEPGRKDAYIFRVVDGVGEAQEKICWGL